MSPTYIELTQNYLSDLERRKTACEKELLNLSIAIQNCKNILEIKVQFSSPIKTRKPPKKVTEKMVRDAVIYLSKNPVDRTNRFPVDENFFTQAHINNYLGIKGSSLIVRKSLEKFVEKGMLQTRPYKRGKQYRYIAPNKAESSLERQITLDINDSQKISDPIPGTGKTSVKTRDKDVEKMLKIAESQGYMVERLGSDHIRVYGESGSTTHSVTSNSSRLVANVRADLRKIGVKL